MRTVYIALFGLLGVLSRYYVGLGVNKVLPHPFPYGTFLINISGAFIIGIVHVLGAERALISPDLRIGIMVGFLGGFTTFSSYCLETARLTESTEHFYALVYFIAGPILGYLAAFGGMILTRFILEG